MRCQCCGEEADSVLETPASGVSLLCQECSESIFTIICQRSENETYRMAA